jgi:hypothetical protein
MMDVQKVALKVYSKVEMSVESMDDLMVSKRVPQ